MASLRVALLLAIAQTARARSATLAAIASNADYANRLYGPSHAVDPRNATAHADYARAKTEAARQRARLAAAHRKACVGGDDDLPVGRRRGPAGWGFLLYRFMVGAETTVIVLLLWVAAAGRAPAVGCRGWHVKISI